MAECDIESLKSEIEYYSQFKAHVSESDTVPFFDDTEVNKNGMYSTCSY